MKKSKKFKYCRYCNAPHEDCSPPAQLDYEGRMIKIENGVILFAKPINGIYAKDIGGIYCNIDCLKKYLQAP